MTEITNEPLLKLRPEIENWGQFAVECSKVVVNKSVELAQKTLKDHPNFVGGAILTAGAVVSFLAADSPIIDALNSLHGFEKFVGVAATMATQALVANEGVKMMTSVDIGQKVVDANFK